MTLKEAATPFVKGFLEILAKFFAFLAIACGWVATFTLSGY